jgi:SAM-dependent methyltransferase
VFEETDGHFFALTAWASALRGDTPTRLSVLFLGRSASWQAAGGLLHTVRAGQTAFEHVHGMNFFEYNHRHPDYQALFDRLMTAQTAPVACAITAAYDFSSFRSILDVGGGLGALAIEILMTNKHLRGMIFDQPHVADRARSVIAAAGLAGRCEAIGGDFFSALPLEADLQLVKFILHDWDDERAVALLRECRRALAKGGRLLVIEAVIPLGNSPSYAKTQDINMLINLGGRERTAADYQELMTAAQFDLRRTIPVLGEIHILEATATI